MIDLEEFDVLKPSSIIRKNDAYMIKDLKSEEVFHFIDFDSREIIRGIRRGSGPGEILSPTSLQLKGDDFFIYDFDRRKLSQIDISTDSILILNGVLDINLDIRLFAINYQESHMIATGLFEDAWLVSLKGNGEIISRVDFPAFVETTNTPNMERSMLYLSTRTVRSPDNKRVAAATQDLGLLSFFNCSGESVLEEYKQLKYYGPEFIVLERGGIAWSKDGMIGFCGLDCDDEYVYTLYSGRTFMEHGMESHHCEHLFVYDWSGNPVKYYTLDIPLFSMKYDKERNTIYGIGYNPEGVFVEYQL